MNDEDRKKFLSGFTDLEDYSPRELNKLHDAIIFTPKEDENRIALFFEDIVFRVKKIGRKLASK
jgi:hypothetical protein